MDTTPLYSPQLIQALETAARLHATQSRKGTRIPYLAHLLGTCAIALEYGANEDEAIAALLHDAIEDVTPTRDAREAVAAFGPEVLRTVEACTDTDQHPKPPWRPRKEAFWVSAWIVGTAAFEQSLWYYRALVEAFRANTANRPALIDELDRTVTEMERLAKVR